MAIAASLLTSNISTADQTSYATASISPAANSLILLFCASSVGSGTAPKLTPSGLSLTWTERVATNGQADDLNRRIQCWTAQCGGSPGSGAITLTCGDLGSGATASGAGWAVIQITGHNTTTPVVQAVGAGGGSGTGAVTLATAGSTENRAFSYWSHRANEGSTPRTNWTELSDHNGSSPSAGHQSQWRSTAFGTDDASATWTDTSVEWNGIAIEIAAASGTLYTASHGGGFTPAAAIARAGTKPASGGFTPAAAIARVDSKPISAGLTPAAALARVVTAFKTPTGAITPAGALPRLTTKPAAGAMTPAATIVRVTAKAAAGAVTPTSTLGRLTTALKTLTGAITPAATAVRLTAKPAAGALTPDAAIATILGRSRSFSGAIDSAATIVSVIGKPLAGAVTSAGTAVRARAMPAGAEITPTGSIGAVRAMARSMAATLTLAGALAKVGARPAAGEIAPTSTHADVFNRPVAGSITSSSVTTRSIAKASSGLVDLAGDILGGALTRAFSGTIGFVGALSRSFVKNAGGAIAPGGGGGQTNVTDTEGVVSPIGALVRLISKPFTASLSPTGQLVKARELAFGSTIGAASTLDRPSYDPEHNHGGTIEFAGAATMFMAKAMASLLSIRGDMLGFGSPQYCAFVFVRLDTVTLTVEDCDG